MPINYFKTFNSQITVRGATALLYRRVATSLAMSTSPREPNEMMGIAAEDDVPVLRKIGPSAAVIRVELAQLHARVQQLLFRRRTPGHQQLCDAKIQSITRTRLVLKQMLYTNHARGGRPALPTLLET